MRVLIAAVAVLLLGLPSPGRAEAPDRIATIGDEVITTDEFAVFLRQYIREKLYHGGSKEMIRRIAVEALDTLIDERLLARVVEERGIRGDPAKAAAQIASFREKYSGSPDWPEIEPRLADIERDLLLDSRIAELRKAVSTVAPPDNATLRTYYAANPKLFTQPAAYDVDLILLGVPPSALKPEWAAAEARADELWRALKNGADFAETARQHSTDASAPKGGAVGRVHLGQLPDALHEALTSMAPGEITDPIRILEGYALLRLNGRFDAELQPFESVRERADALYRRDQAGVQWAEYLTGLRAGADIQTFNVKQHVEAMLTGN